MEQMCIKGKQQEVLEEDTSLGRVVTDKVLPVQRALQAELSEEER